MLLSSLCRQLTSACTIQSKSALKARHLRYHDGQIAAALTSGSTSSSASAISTSNIALGSRHATITTSSTSSIAGGDEPEIVQVLKLNMLKDNPGAVKKVCGMRRHVVRSFTFYFFIFKFVFFRFWRLPYFFFLSPPFNSCTKINCLIFLRFILFSLLLLYFPSGIFCYFIILYHFYFYAK